MAARRCGRIASFRRGERLRERHARSRPPRAARGPPPRRARRVRLRADRGVAADARLLRRLAGAAGARDDAAARARDRLVVRFRALLHRQQLDRHRLHLPGGDAGMAGVDRGRAPLALPRGVSDDGDGCGLAGWHGAAAGRDCCWPRLGSAPSGCARPCSPALPGTRSRRSGCRCGPSQGSSPMSAPTGFPA